MALELFDSALGHPVELVPAEPGRVSMYVCGPTVYDVPHIGHGRFALVFDVLRRYLEWSGLDVTYVSNITDIDDKIIARAREEGRSSHDVAVEFEGVWFRALDALNVRRPDQSPRATEYVKEMVELIRELQKQDLVYVTSDTVYMRAERVDGYGLLAHQSLDSLKSGARVEGDDEKESPLDFALWKKAKDGEPSWESPWFDGRPGWHTECVVMSLGLLGEGFDIHGGGLDLAFPHHENERAQALGLGREFARHWVHNGFVEVGGEKMSKSLGNFTSLTDLLDRTDGRAYRLLVLRSHYRSPVEVTPATIADAESALSRLDAFARRIASLSVSSAEPDDDLVHRFTDAMDDDLDTPAAVAALFDAVRATNAALDADDTDAALPQARAARLIAEALGLELKAESGELPAEIADLVGKRDAARAAKDWDEADRIRQNLEQAGWVVEDTSSGTKVRRA